MIAKIITDAKKYGHKDGELWTMMIHDSVSLNGIEEELRKDMESYKENLEILANTIELTMELSYGTEDIDSNIVTLHQCVAWIRGEIKELERL